MGFLQNFRHDPVRAIGHWYQSRQEMSRYKKRLKAERLWNESLDLHDRLYGTEKKDYRSRYQAIVAMQKASKDKKTIENKAVKPWLYARLFGVPRMVDCMQLRQLAETPIAQLCISTKRAFVKNTPWMIVESDPSEKQLKQIKSLYKDRKERRRAIRNARKKEVSRLLTLSMVDRVKDPRWRELRKKAMSEDSKPNALIDEASQLLSSPNNTNRPFSHYLSMAVVDLEEVGSATWVLKFAPEDFEDAMTDKGTPYTKPKKGAKPIQFDSFDTLQFTKDEDDYGDLLGYYHFMRGWTSVGISGKPRYMSKGEIVWFETDPRPNRPYGVSNTEKAAPDLDLNQLLLEQITTYSAEGLQSPGMLSLKGEGWTPEEFDKFKIYMQEDVKGHPEVIPIVDKEAQWIPFTQNFRESQYLERELWRAKNIAGQFQMNMTVIGLEDGNTNRATAFAHIHLALDLKGAGPMLKDLEYAINTQLIWKYFSPDKKITFFFDPALNAEERERTEISSIRKWEAGLIKKDEARTDMGHEALGPENGGDEFREDGMGADTGLGLGGGYNPRDSVLNTDSNVDKTLKKKERISITDRSQAPEGAVISEGPRGGLYYESGDVGEGADSEPDGDGTAGVLATEIVKALMAERANIGKPKENFRLGKMGEDLLEMHLEGYSVHAPEDWSSPFDLLNGFAIEAKTTRNGKTMMWGNSRGLKVDEAKKLGKDIHVMMWWVKDDRVELYMHEPNGSFFDNLGDRGDMYMVGANDSKLMGWFDTNGDWNEGD